MKQEVWVKHHLLNSFDKINYENVPFQSIAKKLQRKRLYSMQDFRSSKRNQQDVHKAVSVSL